MRYCMGHAVGDMNLVSWNRSVQTDKLGGDPLAPQAQRKHNYPLRLES
jgi:hypothetical protein